MEPEELRKRLADLLSFCAGTAPSLTVHEERAQDGYVEQVVSFPGGEGAVSALLLLPASPTGGAVVVHHQHCSQWQWGKSEVAGLAGNRWQAFGPELARRGVTVLAPDAVGFEDRRAEGGGAEARPSDREDYWLDACYRLVTGRLLMMTVLADAAAAHGSLAALPAVDATRVGAVGHSMGGATTLFHAALDERISFAAVSCAACTYRQRMAEHTGIEAAQVIPGILGLADLDDMAALVAPRPMYLGSATEDKYSRDTPTRRGRGPTRLQRQRSRTGPYP